MTYWVLNISNESITVHIWGSSSCSAKNWLLSIGCFLTILNCWWDFEKQYFVNTRGEKTRPASVGKRILECMIAGNLVTVHAICFNWIAGISPDAFGVGETWLLISSKDFSCEFSKSFWSISSSYLCPDSLLNWELHTVLYILNYPSHVLILG